MLDEGTREEARKYGWNALRAYFGLEELNLNQPDSPALLDNLGVFVTLHSHGQLRGCLGEMETDKALYRSIQELAVAAASHDWRFTPLTREELPFLDIEISVLTKPEKVLDWRQIVLGKHGVIVVRGERKGVFLPQVAEEGNFSLEEFLSLLCSQKAGLPAEAYMDPETDLFTFEAEVF